MSDTKRGDRVFTPEWCARDIVAHFKPNGVVLEPFRGNGVFTGLLPSALWCEIDEGRDFFRFDQRVDWIVTNPPYSKTRDCFRHAARLADHVVFLVPLRNVFSGFGFVREIFTYGGIAEIRVYGTGGSLGFPMGNCVGAVYVRRDYAGPTRWTFYQMAPPMCSLLEESTHAGSRTARPAPGGRVARGQKDSRRLHRAGRHAGWPASVPVRHDDARRGAASNGLYRFRPDRRPAPRGKDRGAARYVDF